MMFQAFSDNTQKIRISFQAFRPDPAGGAPLPAMLDTQNSEIEMIVDTGSCTTAVLPETTGSNGFPEYHVEVISGSDALNLSTGRITADGQPGSGLAHIEDTWTYEVAPPAASGFGVVTVHAAEPK